MAEIQITLRILELSGGGFVIAEDAVGGEEAVAWQPTQAVSTINEACGAIQQRLQTWNNECKMLKLRQGQVEDDRSAMVIEHPRKWWRAIK